MKKLIFFLLLSIPLFAQNYKVLGNGTIWSDSLESFYDTAGVGGYPHASDSSLIIDFNYAYSLIAVVVGDTGSTIKDSIKVYKGVPRYNSVSPKAVDTLWCSTPLPFYNNAWTVDTVMVGAGEIRNYFLLDANIHLLKILNVNKQIISGRVTKVNAEGRKN